MHKACKVDVKPPSTTESPSKLSVAAGTSCRRSALCQPDNQFRCSVVQAWATQAVILLECCVGMAGCCGRCTGMGAAAARPVGSHVPRAAGGAASQPVEPDAGRAAGTATCGGQRCPGTAPACGVRAVLPLLGLQRAKGLHHIRHGRWQGTAPLSRRLSIQAGGGAGHGGCVHREGAGQQSGLLPQLTQCQHAV